MFNMIATIDIRKIIRLICIVTAFLLHSVTQGMAQIENLIVETWYVADANDATDTTEGRSVAVGMKLFVFFSTWPPEVG